MPTFRTLLASTAVAVFAGAPAAPAQTCRPDVHWQHEHAGSGDPVMTTDVKGSRATTLAVCRDPGPATPTLKVEVQFSSAREPRPLEPERCTEMAAKWAVIRTRGSQSGDAPARVSGVYRVCKD